MTIPASSRNFRLSDMIGLPVTERVRRCMQGEMLVAGQSSSAELAKKIAKSRNQVTREAR